MGLTKREVQEVTWKLKRADQEQRFTFLDAMDENPSADRVFEQLKKQDRACPDCAVIEEYRKHGTTEAGTQRYRCTACGTTFVADRHWPTYRSQHDEEKWKAFFERMLDGIPLVDLADEFGLSTRSAYRWRHKLLEALLKIQDVELSGRVWADGTHLNDNKPGRGSTPDQGTSSGKVTILTAKDIFGRVHLEHVADGMGAKQEQVKGSLEDVLDYEHSTLVSDNAGNITGFADEQGVSYEAYDSEEHDGKLDMINWLHSHFKQWIKNFRGVATHRLRHYLAWYQFIQKRRQTNPPQRLIYLPDFLTPENPR